MYASQEQPAVLRGPCNAETGVEHSDEISRRAVWQFPYLAKGSVAIALSSQVHSD